MSHVNITLERPRVAGSKAKASHRLSETLTFDGSKEGILADIAVPNDGDATGWKWNFSSRAPSMVFIVPDLPGEGDSSAAIGYTLAAGEALSIPAGKAGERAMVAPLS